MFPAKMPILFFVLLAVAATSGFEDEPGRLQPPPEGTFYHGVLPSLPYTGIEEPDKKQLLSYEQTVGAEVTWVYFSNNWFTSRKFPKRDCRWIREQDAIPYIRMMIRSSWRQSVEEKKFNLVKILAGDFDRDLKRWGKAAARFGTPLLVEWGTECNGEWFSWNGAWHGGGKTSGYGDPSYPDGPEIFRDTYRHIIDVITAAGADNIVWVFHVNAADWPQEQWNRFENYYPGDDYIGWVAVSAYGPQTPNERWGQKFRRYMDPAYDRLRELAPDKPVIIAEFGCHEWSKAAEKNPALAADAWADAALTDVFNYRWPKVIGFAWWNETWENGGKEGDTIMRVQEIPELAEVFRRQLSENRDKLQVEPVVK